MTWQGKWRGSEGVKQGGDYVFNQESQCTTDIFTTAALFMNDRIHELFFSIGSLKQFKHKTIIILNKSRLLPFPCVHKQSALCTYVWEEMLIDLEVEYQQSNELFHDRLRDAMKAM